MGSEVVGTVSAASPCAPPITPPEGRIFLKEQTNLVTDRNSFDEFREPPYRILEAPRLLSGNG